MNGAHYFSQNSKSNEVDLDDIAETRHLKVLYMTET